MPGSPDPVLGSVAVTVSVACVGGLLATASVVVLRDRFTARSLAVGSGVASAAGCLAVWAGVRLVTATLPNFATPSAAAGWLLLVTLALAVEAGVPAYLAARWPLYAPLAGVFALTATPLSLFCFVRGETDPLALYALFFAPLLLAGTAALTAVELGVRRFAASRQRTRD